MSLNKKVEDFSKEIGRLAIKYDLRSFELNIRGEKHWDKINVSWENGDYGSKSNRIVIRNTEITHTTLDGEDFHS